MSSSQINPDNILAAFSHLSDQLPSLVGESDWHTIQEIVQTKLQELGGSQDANQRRRLAIQLIKAVSPYTAARERLQTELYLMAGLRDRVQPQLAQFAKQFGADDERTALALNVALQAISVQVDPHESVTRYIEINKGGIGGGKQVRVSNIALDYEGLMKLTIGFIPTALEPNPWLFAIGLLLAVLELKDLAEVKISEQDATVFWGLLHTCGRPGHPAGEHEVVASTNKERIRFGLGKLSEASIKTSLSSLTRLGMVEKVEGRFPMWQFVETCHVET